MFVWFANPGRNHKNYTGLADELNCGKYVWKKEVYPIENKNLQNLLQSTKWKSLHIATSQADCQKITAIAL